MDELSPHDIYIRLTDPSGKHPTVINEHRIWNSQRFLASLKEQYQGGQIKPGDLRVVEVVNREDYLATKRRGPKQ
ncbi:hypothetical protein [Uliginosibacterium sediminicola]|uniref:Uncharacterized protein n=1 Tax=Uliginosibacterium sediminicola TaxID=2024550 RepID=A0ABU9YWI2_9RHOO